MGRKILRRLLSYSAVALFTLLLAEFSLQVAGALFPSIDMLTHTPGIGTPLPDLLIADERLGLKGNPDYPDHDRRGFRNPAALDRADIVTLGDSNTYGLGVPRDETWPDRTAKLLGKSHYNMGLGSFGATHSEVIFDTALSLEPETVILALYFGNDFYDDFAFTLGKGRMNEYVSPGRLKEIEALEGAGTIARELDFLFRRTIKLEDGKPGGAAAPDGPGAARAVVDWLSANSRVVGLVRTIRTLIRHFSRPNTLLAEDFQTARQGLSEEQLRYVSVFEGERWKTILTSRYRLRVMDDSDIRIRTGIEISKQTIGRLHARAAARGIGFVVLLVPTKEFVFLPRVADPARHIGLVELGKTEARLHREISDFLTAGGIAFLDATGPLRAAAEQPYHENGDGHLNRLGHRIIADRLAEFLKSADR